MKFPASHARIARDKRARAAQDVQQLLSKVMLFQVSKDHEEHGILDLAKVKPVDASKCPAGKTWLLTWRWLDSMHIGKLPAFDSA